MGGVGSASLACLVCFLGASSSAWAADRMLRKPGRTVMFWLLPGSTQTDPSPSWDTRIAELRAHRANVTGISPCMYSISAGGGFAPSRDFGGLNPIIPEYAKLGLDVVPLIDAAGGLAGMARMLQNPGPFITAAVDAAVRYNYSGYNFDNELRGGSTDKSWGYLGRYGAPWMEFLDKFADALHAEGRILSVDIAGCCGYVDAAHPRAPAGHCAGAFATHEFVSTTCSQYKLSKLDIVYGMSTYSGHINGPAIPDPMDNNTYDGPSIIKTIANATQSGVGADKYALGFKGGWPYCSNGTLPSTCVFDQEAKDTIKYVRDTLGVMHAAQWVDEPRSQAQWDAYGYFLHGDS